MGPKGSVHDVEADVIPQQLAASGRNMVSILAQGKSTGLSRFGISDTGPTSRMCWPSSRPSWPRCSPTWRSRTT